MGVCVLRTIKNIRFLITPLHHHFAIVIYNWGGGVWIQLEKHFYP